MLPQVNATLLSINEPNPESEDWDTDTSGVGPVVWQGQADAYVIERIRTAFEREAGEFGRQKNVTVIIPSDLVDGAGEALTLDAGQIVTYIYRNVTYKRRVMDFTAPYLPGLNISEYIRMHMDPTSVEATQVTD